MIFYMSDQGVVGFNSARFDRLPSDSVGFPINEYFLRYTRKGRA